MVRTVMWQFEEDVGVELLELSIGTDIVAKSWIVRAGVEPFAVRYRLECDAAWHVRSLDVEVMSGQPRVLQLRADGRGRWAGGDGGPLARLEGCIDVDLSATPFTNTLPVRRLRLHAGEAETIAVAYVDVPNVTLERAEQRYTCLPGDDGARYRYESLQDGEVGYTAELELDADGLVVHYPGYARRLSALSECDATPEPALQSAQEP
jgi:hypothetical protein